MQNQRELGKQYDPKQVEDKIYKYWLDGGYFHARPNSGKKPYTIVIPPPNITGQLHMGHALDNTLQDILIRWRRMQGFEALWVPGTDHASIATEAKIVEAMREEGISKDDIGREGFLERAWKWKETYGGRIIEQLKKLGSSCDWERERFTLDEGCSRAVTEVFNRLYEKGLIYRGERIINWCPVCMTSISDAEVDYEEHDGHFWNIRYPIKGGGFLEIATTRPETLLGDTAVAVHPEDERYRSLIGKMVVLPLMDREIPIIADEYVEMDFGTGVVKITPAHDPNDFEVGASHSLPIINVMNSDATINENGGKYAGMPRYEARKAVLADLEALGLLSSVKEHKHNVGSCYRCGTVVEPRVSLQWFVKMEPLAKPAIEAVKKGDTVFIPARFDKVYYNWMENIRDWCVSRQLWWGHRIPAWHCSCGETVVARTEPDKCPRCGGALTRDPDTLDTWFSSALWPFSTLGWPENTPELGFFYPTSTMVTGYDIIFFWVARMIFSGIEQMGKTPFDTVFIHGLVRAADGSKMSKSAGNGIDPLEVIEEYGADALRFMLATGTSPGNDMRYTDEKTRASRNFANKIWNAARYILMNLEDGEAITSPSIPDILTLEDKWALSKYNALVREVTANLEKFELGVAAQKLYDFIWDILCDWYIELTKSRLKKGGEEAQGARQMLVFIMSGTLKLLHPFMPFLTEEIWLALPHGGESIMVSDWPICCDGLNFPEEEAAFGIVIEAIRAIRAVRAEMNVPPSRRTGLYIETEKAGVFAQGIPFILSLAGADGAEIVTGYSSDGSVQVVTPDAKMYIPMDQLVDSEKEKARLEKEKAAAEKEVSFLEGKLANESFTSRAPQNIVEAEKEKLRRARERLAKIEEGLAGVK